MATHDIIDVANLEDPSLVMAAFTAMKKVDAMWTNNLKLFLDDPRFGYKYIKDSLATNRVRDRMDPFAARAQAAGGQSPFYKGWAAVSYTHLTLPTSDLV